MLFLKQLNNKKCWYQCYRLYCFLLLLMLPIYFLLNWSIFDGYSRLFQVLETKSFHSSWSRICYRHNALVIKAVNGSDLCQGIIIFTARCYASAVLAMALCLSVCLSVRPSITSRSSTKTAKQRITRTTPYNSPGTLVLWRQRSPRNSTGVTPYEGAECRWGGSKSVTFDQ